MRKWLGLVVAGLGIQRNINLEAFRSRSFRKTFQAEMFEDRAQPYRYLAALDDVRRRPRIEIENYHPWTANIIRERKRRVQLNRGQVRQPNQRCQIICQY